MADVTLAVLAGGMGVRMGRPKASLMIGGKPILEWLLDRIGWGGPTMLVLAPGIDAAPGMERFDDCVSDPVDGEGPLRGILTALENIQTEMAAVTTVDMPGVDREKLEWLVEELGKREGAMGIMCCMKAGGRERIEPFPSVFRSGAREVIARRLEASKRSVQELTGEEGFAVLEPPRNWAGEMWLNLNTPEELAAFELVRNKNEDVL